MVATSGQLSAVGHPFTGAMPIVEGPGTLSRPLSMFLQHFFCSPTQTHLVINKPYQLYYYFQHNTNQKYYCSI